VARAKAVLAVADGDGYTDAAQAAGRRSGDAVAALVPRFNAEGLAAVVPRHGGGRPPCYTALERERILAKARRVPDRAQDGTAVWSLTTLQRALRQNGLLHVSTYTIWSVLADAGLSWQKHRSWCDTGTAQRRRKRTGQTVGVTVTDPDAAAKLIECAYRDGKRLGLAVGCEDEAGPYQAIPQPGHSGQPAGAPARYPHEYIRGGTAKWLTLFHSATGQVRVKGVTHSPNTVLHPWLKEELTAIVAPLPPLNEVPDAAANRAAWERWQQGLSVRFTLLEELPPLRLLLILDNLTGHKSAAFVCWLMAHGIMPLYTPLGGSGLNMAESIQRILVSRALSGQHPDSPEPLILWLEAVARGWNASPTPFIWGGKRAVRHQQARERRHRLGGSGAVTHPLLPHRAEDGYGYVQSN
jgi:transposase